MPVSASTIAIPAAPIEGSFRKTESKTRAISADPNARSTAWTADARTDAMPVFKSGPKMLENARSSADASNELPPLPPSIAEPKSSYAEPKGSSFWGLGKKNKVAPPEPAPASTKPAATSPSLFGAFAKAKNDVAASKKSADRKSSSPISPIGKPVSNLKPAMPVTEASATRSKTNPAVAPVSYWGAPRPKATDDNSDSDTGTEAASKSKLSRIFSSRS